MNLFQMTKKALILLLLMSLLPVIAPDKVQAATLGTVDGTYDFGGTVGPVDGGFQKVGDKFRVSAGFTQVGTSIWPSNQSDSSLNGYMEIKNESTTINRNYTFRDFGISGTDNSGAKLTFFMISLTTPQGQTIATFDNITIGPVTLTTATRKISSWLNGGSLYNYSNVGKITIWWTIENQAPSKLKFDSVTIAAVKGGYSVTYDGNGSTDGSITPIYYLQNGEATVKSDSGLTRSGYSFVNWNTKADGTGTSYLPGDKFILTSNTVLYARWAPTSFKMTYNGNNATSGSAPADAVFYLPGSAVTIMNKGTLARTGYNFGGWNTKADGTGTNYAAGAAYTMGSASVTLYAKWNVIPTYKVTYNANGATSGSPPTDSASYTAGSTVTVKGVGTLVRTGYTFGGWNTKADGTGTNYAANATLTIGSANVTLHAKWNVIPTYKVTYNANDATSGSSPADSASYTVGSTVTVKGVGTLVRTGYTFGGWNTKADGTGTNYAANATFAMGSVNVTLYAKWNLIPTYKVTYSGNGATAGSPPTDSASYTTASTVTVKDASTLTKTGYTFGGWNTKADGTGTNYAANATFAMGSVNVTLYAKWNLIPTYKMNYNANGASGGSVPIDSGSYASGTLATVLGAGTLTRTGYTLAGWNTAANGSGTDYAAGAVYTIVSANVTLYAMWAVVPAYLITYAGNGSTGGSAPVDAVHYTAGSTVTVKGAGTLTRTGYTFAGWNRISDGSGTNYAANSTFAMGSANLTLYAKWDPIPTYTITYSANGATGGSPPTDHASYISGGTATVLSAGTLTRSGHTFSGWSVNADGTGTSYTDSASLTIGSTNVTLYAKWTAIPTYRVYYNGNGSTGGSVPVDSTDYVSGASVNLLGQGSIVRAGYAFSGWNTKADGTGTSYAAGATLSLSSASVTLYAKWIPTYSVSYNGNGSTGGSVPTDGTGYVSGALVSLPGQGSLVRMGYAFAGWSLNGAGTGTVYQENDTLPIGSANLTLFVKWTLLPTYKLLYNGNGSTSGSVPLDNTGYWTGLNAAVKSQGTLARTGYAFTGWNTQAGGAGTGYSVGDTLAIGSGNATLYAQWTPLPAYTITYHDNGATGGSVPVDSISYLSGQTAVIENDGGLLRTSYVFTGWNTQADGAGTGYASGTTHTIVGNLILYAEWAVAPEYKVTYNGNGATGGSVPVDTGSYLNSDAVTLLGVGDLTRTGYAFGGWSQNTDGTGTIYQAGVLFLMGTANVTLYAKWNPTYSVNYDGNGATGGSVPVDAGVYEEDDNVVVNGASTLVKEGFKFAGWNTQADGNGTIYSAGSTLAMDANDMTLYAKWSPTYRVAYDGNGATGGSVSVDTARYEENDDAIVLGDGTLMKVGYVFAGWNTQPDGNGDDYAAGSVLAIGTVDVQLYAQWTPIPTHTVTYDGNGATGAVPTDGDRYANGESVTLAGSATLALAEHTFAGWNTQADGTGDDYTANDTLTMGTMNLTLYAQWMPIPKHSVSYDANGGTGAVPSDSLQYAENEAVAVKAHGSLARGGYMFGGWSLASGGGTVYAANDTLTMGTADLTLYAQWTAIPTYSVTYNGNGASSGSAPLDGDSYQAGDTVTVLGNSGSLARTGYTFGGWSLDAGGNGIPYMSGDELTLGAANMTLYALWEQVPLYSVTYYGDGATGGIAPTDSGQYAAGATVTVQGHGTLVNMGFAFDGWTVEGDVTGTVHQVGDMLTMDTVDIVLHAKWALQTFYSVTYNGNGATSGEDPADTHEYTSGDSATVLDEGMLVRDGYTFDGWSLSADGSGTMYQDGATLTLGLTDIILYAQWTRIPAYTVTYDGNGATGGSAPLDGSLYVENAVVILEGLGSLSNAGYDFAGWNTDLAQTGTHYDVGETFAMGIEDVTLYAEWLPVPTYNLTYSGNGATNGSDPTDPGNYEEDDQATILGQGSLSNAGHAFAGWNTADDGTGTTYAEGDELTIANVDVTLYAQWTLLLTYTVNYSGNSETSGSVPDDTDRYTAGETVMLAGTGSLARVGHVFAGWNTEADGTGILYAAGGPLTMTAADVTLYAQWELIQTYYVTYLGNGYTSGVAPLDETDYQSGELAIVMDGGTMSRPGYSFAGWNTETDSSGTRYAPGATLTMGAANMTLYAQWSVAVSPATSPPVIWSPPVTRTAILMVGDDRTLQLRIPISRLIDANGRKRDQVTLEDAAATQVLMLAAERDKHAIRVIVDDVVGDPAHEVTVTIRQDALKRIRSNVSLEVWTALAHIAVSAEQLAGLPQADFQVKLAAIDPSEEHTAFLMRVTAAAELQGGSTDSPQLVGEPVVVTTSVPGLSLRLLLRLQEASLPDDAIALETYLKTLSIYVEHANGSIERKYGQLVSLTEGKLFGSELVQMMGDSATFAIVSKKGQSLTPYMNGFPDGKFRPNHQLSRAEVATTLYRLLLAEGATMIKIQAISVTDVAESHWAAEAIAAITGAGLMKVEADGKFQPNALVTRAEMAMIIVRWKGLSTEGRTSSFADTNDHPAAAAIAAVSAKGYMIGVSNGKFKPNGILTRAEAVTLINRLMGIFKPNGSVEQRWPDVPPNHWAFLDIEAATRPGAGSSEQ